MSTPVPTWTRNTPPDAPAGSHYAGGCAGTCDLLGSHAERADHVAHHNEVVRILTDLDLEGLAWLLDQLESAGEMGGPEIWPGQLNAVAGQHNFSKPVLVERVTYSIDRAYQRNGSRRERFSDPRRPTLAEMGREVGPGSRLKSVFPGGGRSLMRPPLRK